MRTGNENKQPSLMAGNAEIELDVTHWHTFGEGTTLNEFMILSGYSSRILEMSSVPIPEPVPPPREWVSWKPWTQSQFSVSLRTTSNTESTSSAPSV